MKDELNAELDGITSGTNEPAAEARTQTPVRVVSAVPPDEVVAPPEVVRQEVGVDRVLKLLSDSRSRLQQFKADFFSQAEQLDPIRRGNPSANRNLPARREFLRMKPALVRLVAYSSGLIESARIPELDKIEIGLLLAGVEHELESASTNIA